MEMLTVTDLNLHIGKKTICKQLNVSVSAGEIWGILGCNGAGKTTLLHALAGLYVPVAGEIKILGKNLSHYSRKELAQLVGILLQQENAYLGDTVYSSILHTRFPY